MTIVCLGDSITYGYGIDRKDCWVNVLNGMNKGKFINKGIPGNTTVEMRVRFKEDVAPFKPDKVIIMGGTNDIFLNIDIKFIMLNINSIADVCRSIGAEPVVMTPLSVNEDIKEKVMFEERDYKRVNQLIKEYRERLISNCRERYIECLDLGEIISREMVNDRDYIDDGIHITAEVHRRIAEIIYKSGYVNMD